MPHPNHIYQAFYFDYRILEHFYAGNEFSRYRSDMEPEELMDLAYEMLAGQGVAPKLMEQIEAIMGKEHCIYDFWEFGPDCFSLYWHIDKSVYTEKLARIRAWLQYAELQDLVDFADHSKNSQSAYAATHQKTMLRLN